ncbi:putative alpha-ketoglutarate-dependent sulfonate dioxygenase [Colletotrichum gloeosporioides]|uniref:Putative alpha-ketoglutarate-dependent sulfonate dioxygenase n=1 Tax=Colletotrichum gloeosporioides TaxID=474922 RepID=A0A8H4CCS1_COLGL|nr:putative alpha-ketoglutarate-dependent sulfonate dioxygenase [Colletotrichum gloeosporioides]KAF3801397.1 putative alpha-ketoglutarate-dependent sulfonate dioxygenase [Colletotrichum gloeosporioides]
MSTTTTTTAEAEQAPIKLTLAYDDKIHDQRQYKYSQYLPVYDEKTSFPPLQPFEFNDRGLVANKEKLNLLPKDSSTIKATKLTPVIGTEIRGLQLSQLDDRQKDELALLIAERGVVVFRDQDFKDISVEKQKEFGSYFGPLHVHSRDQPVGAHVKDHLELHNIYLGPDNEYRNRSKSNKLSTIGYHSDVSYEHQSPGVTILTLLSVPETGGDTAWVSQTAAYARLSRPIQTLLEGLRAEHSGFPQAENARRDGKFVRREPVKSEHPVVRVHPATGQKALFINPGFTKKIIGLRDEESDALLKLLFKVRHQSSTHGSNTDQEQNQHITLGQDFQVRIKWEEGTVALWDNRVTAHTAISDYNVHNPQEGLRHGFRITTLADKPTGVNGLESTW